MHAGDRDVPTWVEYVMHAGDRDVPTWVEYIDLASLVVCGT